MRGSRLGISRAGRLYRFSDGPVVLSELPSEPGPTHSVFDVMAACVACFTPGPRVAVLGFAAGGLVAPLRAMGFNDPLVGVDTDLDGARLFRRVSARWGGGVWIVRDEASRWLAQQRRPFDGIVEDLSVNAAGKPTKPTVSVRDLPRLIFRRLARRGIAVIDALPVAGLSWPALIDVLTEPFGAAQVVHLEGEDNQIVLAGRSLPSARMSGDRLREALASIGSRTAGRIAVRAVPGR